MSWIVAEKLHGILGFWNLPASEGWPASSLGDRAQHSLILHQRPFAVRIVFPHRPRHPGSLFAKIPLKNLAVLIDDEGHDARLVPKHRIGHQREPPRQAAVANVVHFPA